MIINMPCISYSHMDPDTSIWLQLTCEEGAAEGPGFIVALTNSTCFLVPPIPEDRADYPQDLLDIFAYADEHAEFGWLMLDVDGDVVDLPTY